MKRLLVLILATIFSLPSIGQSGTDEEYEHRYLQQINLYRLADSTFALTQPQEDSLYFIAGGATTQAPLAKALLTVLQDTIFPIGLPDEPVHGRSASEPE